MCDCDEDDCKKGAGITLIICCVIGVILAIALPVASLKVNLYN